ncbi:hypothetical protein Godav_006192, partial [Gossypium davidsonii]|nr:hypothetical protein [Gossypium davidsonii]
GVGTVSVGVVSPDNCGLLFGVAYFWKQDVPTPLVVEAGLIKSTITDKFDINMLIWEAKLLVTEFTIYHFQHIHRLGNIAAHLMENEGFHLQCDSWWVNDGLATIHSVVHEGHYLLEGWVVARNVDLYLAYCWERRQGYSYSGEGHFNGFIDLQAWEVTTEPVELPQGPITQSRAKRFQDALASYVDRAWGEQVPNSLIMFGPAQ